MANVHMKYDLEQMKGLPLEAKIIMSQRRIRDWYDYWQGNVYVSFSGGKDSTVLKHLVENTPGVYNVPVVFIDTGLEYPEVRRFASERADIVLRPEMRFDEVIKKYGYPVISKEVANMIHGAKPGNTRWLKLKGEAIDPNTGKPSVFNAPKWGFMLDAQFKVSDKCCDVMKKRPARRYEKETGRKPFLGLLASESLKRRRHWEKTGCNAYYKSDPQSQPMAFWTEQDVLAYIKLYDLEFASVYGDIVEGEDGKLKTTLCDRTGCIFCGFGCHMEKGENRFQRLKKTHPRQYEYCINGGQYVWKGTAYTSDNEPMDIPWINDDGSPMTYEQIEEFVKENKDKPYFKFEKLWIPNGGLGLGKVLDYIGINYK